MILIYFFSDLNNAIRLNPNYPDAFFNRALLFHYVENFSSAVSDYETVLRLDPNHIGAYFNRAILYHENGDIAKAISDYETVMSLDPNHDETKYFLEDARNRISFDELY